MPWEPVWVKTCALFGILFCLRISFLLVIKYEDAYKTYPHKAGAISRADPEPTLKAEYIPPATI